MGIAEEHAVTMAAGMAVRGLRPVCAIYSTFLQRGYDQLLHDVAIQGNPVVFAVDRAGLVGADGETHQGIFDVPYLRTVPGLRLLSPSSFAELRRGLEQALLREKGPTAIRYPRAGRGPSPAIPLTTPPLFCGREKMWFCAPMAFWSTKPWPPRKNWPRRAWMLLL